MLFFEEPPTNLVKAFKNREVIATGRSVQA